MIRTSPRRSPAPALPCVALVSVFVALFLLDASPARANPATAPSCPWELAAETVQALSGAGSPALLRDIVEACAPGPDGDAFGDASEALLFLLDPDPAANPARYPTDFGPYGALGFDAWILARGAELTGTLVAPFAPHYRHGPAGRAAFAELLSALPHLLAIAGEGEDADRFLLATGAAALLDSPAAPRVRVDGDARALLEAARGEGFDALHGAFVELTVAALARAESFPGADAGAAALAASWARNGNHATAAVALSHSLVAYLAQLAALVGLRLHTGSTYALARESCEPFAGTADPALAEAAASVAALVPLLDDVAAGWRDLEAHLLGLDGAGAPGLALGVARTRVDTALQRLAALDAALAPLADEDFTFGAGAGAAGWDQLTSRCPDNGFTAAFVSLRRDAAELSREALLRFGTHLRIGLQRQRGLITDLQARVLLAEALPGASDADGDGLPDLVEVSLGTDPASEDSDGDGLGDLAEIGTLHTEARPVYAGALSAPGDTDGDGLSDAEELERRFTDPFDPDTDGDGLLDGADPEPGLAGWLHDGFRLRDWDDDGFDLLEELTLASGAPAPSRFDPLGNLELFGGFFLARNPNPEGAGFALTGAAELFLEDAQLSTDALPLPEWRVVAFAEHNQTSGQLRLELLQGQGPQPELPGWLRVASVDLDELAGPAADGEGVPLPYRERRDAVALQIFPGALIADAPLSRGSRSVGVGRSQLAALDPFAIGDLSVGLRLDVPAFVRGAGFLTLGLATPSRGAGLVAGAERPLSGLVAPIADAELPSDEAWRLGPGRHFHTDGSLRLHPIAARPWGARLDLGARTDERGLLTRVLPVDLTAELFAAGADVAAALPIASDALVSDLPVHLPAGSSLENIRFTAVAVEAGDDLRPLLHGDVTLPGTALGPTGERVELSYLVPDGVAPLPAGALKFSQASVARLVPSTELGEAAPLVAEQLFRALNGIDVTLSLDAQTVVGTRFGAAIRVEAEVVPATGSPLPIEGLLPVLLEVAPVAVPTLAAASLAAEDEGLTARVTLANSGDLAFDYEVVAGSSGSDEGSLAGGAEVELSFSLSASAEARVVVPIVIDTSVAAGGLVAPAQLHRRLVFERDGGDWRLLGDLADDPAPAPTTTPELMHLYGVASNLPDGARIEIHDAEGVLAGVGESLGDGAWLAPVRADDFATPRTRGPSREAP